MTDDKNPWARKPEQGPPDLLKLLKGLFAKKSSGSSGGGEHSEVSLTWLWLVVALLVVIWFVSGIFIVNQPEEAAILKFGKYVGTVGPGPHWIPSLIESEAKVDIQQIRNFQYQSEMLTQDENIVNVSLAVQYRIDNVRDYLFNVVDPAQTLQQATASALRQVVGQMTLDAILTTGRGQLRDDVAKQLDATLQDYHAGFSVTDVRLLPAKPPEAVTEAFDDAIKAREDEQSSINLGEAYARKVTSEVKGQVAQLQQTAQAYQQEVVLRATGDVARYEAVLKPYEQAPTVTRERLYLDTLQDVLSHTSNVIVDSGAHNLLYLPLDKMISQHMAKTDANLDLPSSDSNSASLANQSESSSDTMSQYGKTRPTYSSADALTGGNA